MLLEKTSDNPRRAFFDRVAHNWNDILSSRDEKFLKYIVEKASTPEKAGRKVLDIGCGCGVLFPFLTDWEVTAFDISEEMLKRARLRSFTNVTNYVQGDAHDLPFPDNYFAKIFMMAVFPHFENPKKVLQEIYRTLKPEGVVTIVHLKEADKINDLHRSIGGAIANDCLPHREYLLSLIKETKFEIEYKDFQSRVAVIFRKSIEQSDLVQTFESKYLGLIQSNLLPKDT